MAKDTLTSEKQQLDEERDEHFRVKTTLEFDISDLRDSEKNDHESRVSRHRSLSQCTCSCLVCPMPDIQVQCAYLVVTGMINIPPLLCTYNNIMYNGYYAGGKAA